MPFSNAISRLFLLLLLTFHVPASTDSAPSFPPLIYSPDLQQQLAQSLQSNPQKNYRTAHLREDGSPLYSNRLLLADSPYLQQHAHNPVDWHEWNSEAWDKAKALNRPIFLSIGYATCHWCHVMEEESFDDPAIAALINQRFIAIKVDREALPQVDRIYMDAARRLMGYGGWPLNLILTPDRAPYRGGTYFPTKMLHNFLDRAVSAYDAAPAQVNAEANAVWDQVQRSFQTSQRAGSLNQTPVEELKASLLESFDEFQGGFAHAPKFPYESRLQFLLHQQSLSPDDELSEQLHTTLQAMAKGALFDQLGGGFHRYTVDDDWQEPHYEKMLYNQASLLNTYRTAWLLSGEPLYKHVVEMTVGFLLREMRDQRGLFYAAFDADDAGGEGRYYQWSKEEITDALGSERANQFLQFYAIAENIRNEEAGPLLVIDESAEAVSRAAQERLRESLFAARQKRDPPFLDRKIITAWNAQTIRAIALAADALSRPDWSLASQQSLNTLWLATFEKHGTPIPRYIIADTAGAIGGLADHASLLEALVNAYRLDKNPLWLKRAEQLAQHIIEHFADVDTGVLYETASSDSSGLGFRPLSQGDQDKPEGSATALRAFQQLAIATGDLRWSDTVNTLIATYAERIKQTPNRWSEFLTAWQQHQFGDASPVQWAAKGKVHLRLERNPLQATHSHKLIMQMHRDWHVQSNSPSEKNLVATELKGADGKAIQAIVKPGAEFVQTTQNSKPLSLYSGLQRFDFSPEQGDHSVAVTLQACDDKTCLAPETVSLQIPRM